MFIIWLKIWCDLFGYEWTRKDLWIGEARITMAVKAAASPSQAQDTESCSLILNQYSYYYLSVVQVFDYFGASLSTDLMLGVNINCGSRGDKWGEE